MNLDLETVPYSPRFRELLKARKLLGEEEIRLFLEGNLDCLSDPFLMKGMREACRRVRRAVDQGEQIMVHGDYDVDGVTGAAIVTRTLQVLGGKPCPFLPHREEDGYGVSARAIERAAGDGVTLLITVDCGITAFEQIRLARHLGMEVIIIDHHKIPAEGLPPADIILNPLQTECSYPFKELSAAGLAFKLSFALLREKAFAFLDLAAVSTVCDVAPLVDENRIIVKSGLKLLSRRTNPGIKALSMSARVSAHELNVGHIGFVYGPRINAAGRMGSPDMALRLLLTENEREARSLAEALNEENKTRQREERLTTKEAVREVEKIMNFNRDRVIVVARQGWHAGVIGIVAARLVDKYHRPAIVIALDGDTGKGSGRSIKGFNLYDAMAHCSDCFTAFGGHAQAAGLSMETAKVPELRRLINEYAAENAEPSVFQKRINWEMELELRDLEISFARELNLMEPHGAGNPRPVFRTTALRIKTEPVRLSSQRCQFYVTDGSLMYEAVWTQRQSDGPASAGRDMLKKDAEIDMVYTVKLKRWQGEERITLEVKEIRPR